MLRASAMGQQDGKPHRLLIFGLSDENIKRMREGKAVKVPLGELGLPDGTVLIFWGRDEHHLADQMKELIGPKTKVLIDPKLTN